jgi:transposase
MINVPAGARILLATQPVDFRRGAHGLAALAQEVLAEDPFSGAIIVWRCKRGDRVKILVWDSSGLVLIWSRCSKDRSADERRDETLTRGIRRAVRWTRLDACPDGENDSKADRGRVGFVRDRFPPGQRAEPA